MYAYVRMYTFLPAAAYRNHQPDETHEALWQSGTHKHKVQTGAQAVILIDSSEGSPTSIWVTDTLAASWDL